MKRPVCCGLTMKMSARAGSGNQRWTCRRCGFRTTNNRHGLDVLAEVGYDKERAAINSDQMRKLAKRKGGSRFIITCAQNNTRVYKNFLKSLEVCSRDKKAMLVVVPIHYKNISLFTGSKDYNKIWDSSIRDYIVDEEVPLGRGLVLRADMHIAATTLNPLTGKEPINGVKWTIFGHPQFAMEPVASPGDAIPKRMYTTGAITVPNYSETNLGARAKFHHVQGAMLVEIQGNQIFIRQLNADGKGCFYDLDSLYTPDGVTRGHSILTLTTGDEHVKFNRKVVRQATYDAHDSIVKTLKPKYIVRHDVLDGYAGSHHHEYDDVLLFSKFHKRDNDYRKELDQVVDFIKQTTPRGAINLIVPSNHHDHLYKWLSRVDPKRDPSNALLIHELKAKQYANAIAGLTTDPFEIYVLERVTSNIVFLDRSKPHIIAGVNYSQHGDIGANGSRGSARAMAKSTHKMVIGHSHGARIVRGVYQVGTSTARLDYEKGLSDHTNTHCIQYANGKRTLVDVFSGKWRIKK